ncbi:MAG TPA: NUDIX domain-containing protein [Candidatus Obscuribacterales bacterium]
MTGLILPAMLLAALGAGYVLQRRTEHTAKVALVLLFGSMFAMLVPSPQVQAYASTAFFFAMAFGWGMIFADKKNKREKLKEGRPAYRFCPNCATPLEEREFEGKKKLACTFCSFVYWNNPIPVAVALIPSTDGKSILLVERGVPPKEGTWAMPAGFLETGEGPEQGAVREAKEEAGVDIMIDRHLVNFPLPQVNQVLMVFLAKPTDQAPKPGSDAKSAKYFPLAQLPENIAFPLHRKAIEDWQAAR